MIIVEKRRVSCCIFFSIFQAFFSITRLSKTYLIPIKLNGRSCIRKGNYRQLSVSRTASKQKQPIGLWLWFQTPLSTVFQLYPDGHYTYKQPEYIPFRREIYYKKKKPINGIFLNQPFCFVQCSFVYFVKKNIVQNIWWDYSSIIFLVISQSHHLQQQDNGPENSVRLYGLDIFMVFRATFINISIILWRSVLVAQDTVVHGEYHIPEVTDKRLSHNDVSSSLGIHLSPVLSYLYSLVYLLPKIFKLVGFPFLFIMSILDEGYSGSASSSLRQITRIMST